LDAVARGGRHGVDRVRRRSSEQKEAERQESAASE
jgi:hypothetical protein